MSLIKEVCSPKVASHAVGRGALSPVENSKSSMLKVVEGRLVPK